MPLDGFRQAIGQFNLPFIIQKPSGLGQIGDSPQDVLVLASKAFIRDKSNRRFGGIIDKARDKFGQIEDGDLLVGAEVYNLALGLFYLG